MIKIMPIKIQWLCYTNNDKNNDDHKDNDNHDDDQPGTRQYHGIISN